MHIHTRTHTHARTRTHTHTHTRARAHTHTHLHRSTQLPQLVLLSVTIQIPFSGRNPHFNRLVYDKPKILALNKIDLADPSKLEATVKTLLSMGEKEVVPVNCRAQYHRGVKEMVRTIQRCLTRRGRPPQEAKETKIMVVGMPNVGKSSFINALRRSHCGRGDWVYDKGRTASDLNISGACLFLSVWFIVCLFVFYLYLFVFVFSFNESTVCVCIVTP